MMPLRLRPPSISARRHFTISPRARTTRIPYLEKCPDPSCPCAPAPTLPEDLPIDTKTPLLNTMAPYSEQVIVCTGKSDWTSRIEDEEGDAGDFVRGLKGIIGRGGEAFDPYNNVLVTAGSFSSSPKPGTTTALLFPSFRRIEAIPNTRSVYSTFATAFLKAKHLNLNPTYAKLSDTQKGALIRNRAAWTRNLPDVQEIRHVTVLICGHGGRDQRCGIIGPVLQEQFESEFLKRGIPAEVGLISHIGGHKYAGNVIIYIPPLSSRSSSENLGALNGCGIWYGRVAPEHVEGIVRETVTEGQLIKDLFRGGISRDGSMLGRILEEQMKKDNARYGGLRLEPKAR